MTRTVPVVNLFPRGGFSPWRPAAPQFRMGQAAPPPISMDAPTVPDLPAAVSSDEWAAQPWTKEEAITTFNVVNLLWTVREKVAFSAILFHDLIADPSILAVVNRSEKGAEFIDVTNSYIKLSQQLSLPNFMSSVRNLLNALGTRILPKLGIGVKGMRPLFRTQAGFPKILDCVKEDMSAGKKEVVDFGDLCKTSLLTDLKALQVATQDASQIAPEIRLGVLSVLAKWAIQFAIRIVGILLVGRLVAYPIVARAAEAINPTISNPDVLKQIERIAATDPKKAQELFERIVQGEKVWEKATNVAMWIGLAVGTVALAWIVSSLTRK